MAKTIQVINKCRSIQCGLEFAAVILHRPANNYLVATACPMCRSDLDILHSMIFEIDSPERERHEVTGTVQRRPLDVADAQNHRDRMSLEVVTNIEELLRSMPPERLEHARNEFRAVFIQMRDRIAADTRSF